MTSTMKFFPGELESAVQIFDLDLTEISRSGITAFLRVFGGEIVVGNHVADFPFDRIKKPDDRVYLFGFDKVSTVLGVPVDNGGLDILVLSRVGNHLILTRAVSGSSARAKAQMAYPNELMHWARFVPITEEGA